MNMYRYKKNLPERIGAFALQDVSDVIYASIRDKFDVKYDIDAIFEVRKINGTYEIWRETHHLKTQKTNKKKVGTCYHLDLLQERIREAINEYEESFKIKCLLKE